MRREGHSVRSYKECLDCDRLAKKDGEGTPPPDTQPEA